MHDPLLNQLIARRDPALLTLTGLLVIALSLPCVLAMCHDVMVGADNLVGALMAGGFAGVIVVIGLVFIGIAAQSHHERGRIARHERERVVLQAARQHGGHLTVADLAVDSGLTVAESAALLDQMERVDLAQGAVSDAGQVVYVFPAFATPRDKLTAHGHPSALEQFEETLNEATSAATPEVVEVVEVVEVAGVAEVAEVGRFSFWKRR